MPAFASNDTRGSRYAQDIVRRAVPADRSRRRSRTTTRSPELAANVDRAATPAARAKPVDPRGRCRLMQWLRTRDPRAQQRVLRSGALRLRFVALAATCRRTARDRAGHQEHARGAARAPTTRHPDPNGSSPSATARSTAVIFPDSYAVVGEFRPLCPSIFISPAAPASHAVAQGPAVLLSLLRLEAS